MQGRKDERGEKRVVSDDRLCDLKECKNQLKLAPYCKV